MEYLEIKNLEKYNPGYTDRNLIWCKTYFSMLNSDPEFEMLDETDKFRYIAFIMIQIQIKKPVPLDPIWLARKGFNFRKRPMSLTLKMLHNFITVRNGGVTEGDDLVYPRVEGVTNAKSRVEGCNRVDRFAPPTKIDVVNYCLKEKITLDSQKFVDFYESKGWMIGKSKMKSWEAAARNWARRDKEKNPVITRASEEYVAPWETSEEDQGKVSELIKETMEKL